ncbi:hypothetical protein QZH41_012635 [Actinostola sp. cb2023]|nr:hypothetical protein QZH41_012635 [Actinostola sp. cb2023]
MAKSIKKKKRAAEAFMCYTGCSSWAQLQTRFPRHATEEKLAQFSTLQFKGKEKEIPMELQNFFERALEVEQELNTSSQLRLNVEGEKGVYYYEKELAVGVLVAGEMATINTTLIKRIIPGFKGFTLTIVTLSADVDDNAIRRFLMALHSMNVSHVDFYHVVFHLEETNGLRQIESVKGHLEKMSAIQVAYYVVRIDRVLRKI